jgi:hypothetical protein
MNVIFNMLERFDALSLPQSILYVFIFATVIGLGEVWLLETIDNLYYNFKSKR